MGWVGLGRAFWFAWEYAKTESKASTPRWIHSTPHQQDCSSASPFTMTTLQGFSMQRRMHSRGKCRPDTEKGARDGMPVQRDVIAYACMVSLPAERPRSINQSRPLHPVAPAYAESPQRLARLDTGQTLLATAKPVFARGERGYYAGLYTPMSHFPDKPPTQAVLRAQRQLGVRRRDPRRATGPFTQRIGLRP